DLLHLAERLGVGLADLARDEPRERLLVVFHKPADLLDRTAADWRGHVRPGLLGLARRAAGGHEGGGVAEEHLGDDVRATGGVGWGEAPTGGVRLRPPADHGGDGARGGKGVGHAWIVEPARVGTLPRYVAACGIGSRASRCATGAATLRAPD